MGFKASQVAHVLRFSGGWETTDSDWEALGRGIGKVFAEVHQTYRRAALRAAACE
jgi:hypothetical protein